MKIAVALAAVALLLAGCGGGSDEPTASKTVSVDKFCAQVEALDTIDTVAAAKKAVSELGTPAGMPADAAAGYKALRKALDSIAADTKVEDFSGVLLKVMGGANGADVRKVEAFTTWISGKCDK